MRLLKQVVNEGAGEKIPEAYFLEYVEDFSSENEVGRFARSRSLLKLFSSKAAGSLDAEAYYVPYVEVGKRLRTRLEDSFSRRYSSRIAPWRTVICVTGSPELFNSLRI